MYLQWTIILSALWLLWRQYRRSVVKSPLRNLAGPPSASWLKGNLEQIYSQKALTFHHDIVKTYGGAVKVYGMAGDEQVYVSDPRALHNILIKDQYIFEETSMFVEINRLQFGEGLLSSLGEHHKKQRKMLNPVFSINHMRDLTPLFYEITHKSLDVLAGTIGSGGAKTINMLEVMSSSALEFIGQGGLGYSFDVLGEGKKNPYTDSVRNLIPVLSGLQIELIVLPYLVKLGPPAFRRFLVDLLPHKAVQKWKSMIDVIDHTSTDVLAKKRAALAQGDEAVLKQVGGGKDIMSILLRANAAASEEDRLPEKEVLGQMSTIIFGGHDTTSSAMARTLHLLCLHPDVQEKLRLEVTEARAAHGDLSYDEVMSLPYLDAVCRETLRLHAPVPMLSRTARKAVTIPLHRPVKGTDGQLIHEVPIAEGQNVIIGISTANSDPAIWGPDAAEWKPERWLAPMPQSVTSAHLPGVYSGMMTFMGGDRACIGFKFSQLEMKIIISKFLERFSFSLPDEDIVWNFGNILSPCLKGREDETPCLPLKVSLVV